MHVCGMGYGAPAAAPIGQARMSRLEGRDGAAGDRVLTPTHFRMFALFFFAAIAMFGFYRMSVEVNQELPPDAERFPKVVDRGRSFELIKAHLRYCPGSLTQIWTGAALVVVFLLIIGYPRF
jgi:hypothetical protein